MYRAPTRTGAKAGACGGEVFQGAGAGRRVGGTWNLAVESAQKIPRRTVGLAKLHSVRRKPVAVRVCGPKRNAGHNVVEAPDVGRDCCGGKKIGSHTVVHSACPDAAELTKSRVRPAATAQRLAREWR